MLELITVDQIQACEWRVAVRCRKCGETFCTNVDGGYRDVIDSINAGFIWCNKCETEEAKQ